MIERIAYLRAERANISELLRESREVVPPAVDRDGAAREYVATLNHRLTVLDSAISEWESVVVRVL